jgi:hypothetical protein
MTGSGAGDGLNDFGSLASISFTSFSSIDDLRDFRLQNEIKITKLDIKIVIYKHDEVSLAYQEKSLKVLYEKSLRNVPDRCFMLCGVLQCRFVLLLVRMPSRSMCFKCISLLIMYFSLA